MRSGAPRTHASSTGDLDVPTSGVRFPRAEDTSWGRLGLVTLALAVLVGGALRLDRLGGVSFSDDEVFKVNAVEGYRAGRYTLTGDDEHPLLMKLSILASWRARDAWNAHVSPQHALSIEAATRAPNAIAGALCAILVALLGRELLSRRAGLFGAILWAVEPITIGFSRVAKEDTLLTLFLIASLVCVVRARRAADEELPHDRRWEVAAAALLGLAFASKYFFHLALPIPLYYVWSRRAGTRWRVPLSRWLALGALAAAVFFAVNPTVLAPANLRYIVDYLTRPTLHRHAYRFMGELYMNRAQELATRTPWYFYFVFLAVKLPLPLLAATAIGGVSLVTRKAYRDPARLFASFAIVWLVFHALLSGGKFTRYLMPLMPMVLLTAALGVETVASWARRAWTPTIAWAGLVAIAAPTALAALETAPHERMFLNALGGDRERLRWWFPHCDFYDVGVREAIAWVCAHGEGDSLRLRAAPQPLTRYYAAQCSRTRIDVSGLAPGDPPCDPARECVEILQVGRASFETEPLVAARHQRSPDAVVEVLGVNVAEVYTTGARAPHTARQEERTSVGPFTVLVEPPRNMESATR